MRDMVFKNLTSQNKKKRILWASETIREDGVLTKIHKYLIYIVKETVEEEKKDVGKPEIFVTKYKNTNDKTEKFQIKMKGCVYCVANERYFLVNFCHTLKIDLCPSRQVELS